MIRKILTTTLIAAMAAAGFAWGPEGHMAVAAIAMNHIKPSTRQRIDEILQDQGDEVFQPVSTDPVKAATWPDDIRPFAQISQPDWHFIDLPLSFDGSHPSNPNLAPKPINAKTQLLALLSGSVDHVSDADRYAWIVHIVGDIHQPLHTATLFGNGFGGDGDRGGNNFFVKARVPTGNGQIGMRKTKLHHYWDDIFHINGESDLNDLVSKIEGDSAGMSVQPLPSDASARDALIQSWIDESNALAKGVAYSQDGNGTSLLDQYPAALPAGYYKKSLSTAESQVAKAGFRLAAVLDAIYSSPNETVLNIHTLLGDYAFSLK